MSHAAAIPSAAPARDIPSLTDDCTDGALFDAVVWPHDAMSATALTRCLRAIACFAGVGATAALAHGLWPISIMILVDASVLATCLAAARRSRRRYETIRIQGGCVTVARGNARGAEVVDRLPLFGLGLERHDDPDYGCRSLYLTSSGRRLEIVRDLSPAERDGFCAALVAAIRDDGGRVTVQKVGFAPYAGAAA